MYRSYLYCINFYQIDVCKGKETSTEPSSTEYFEASGNITDYVTSPNILYGSFFQYKSDEQTIHIRVGCSTPMDKGSPTKFEGNVEQVNKTEKKRWELRVNLTSKKLKRKYSLDLRKRRKAQLKAKIRKAKLRSKYESDTTWSGSESDVSLSDSASYTTDDVMGFVSGKNPWSESIRDYRDDTETDKYEMGALQELVSEIFVCRNQHWKVKCDICRPTQVVLPLARDEDKSENTDYSSEDSGRCPVHGSSPDQPEEVSEGLVHSSDPCPVHGCLPEGGNMTVTNDSPSASQLVVTKSENTDHMDGHKDSTVEHHSSEQSENTESRAKNVGEVDVSEGNVMNNNEEDDNSSGKLFV